MLVSSVQNSNTARHEKEFSAMDTKLADMLTDMNECKKKNDDVVEPHHGYIHRYACIISIIYMQNSDTARQEKQVSAMDTKHV
jgi:hypothetical protein